MKRIMDYEQRPWDPDNRFTAGRLFRTEFWTVEVSYRQHTPGSFIIFLNRYVTRFSELTGEELQTLAPVMATIEAALARHPDLHPDTINYLQLGNKYPHFHLHGIPRYKTTRNFLGRSWEDTTFGSSPMWSVIDVSQDTVTGIRKEFIASLR